MLDRAEFTAMVRRSEEHLDLAAATLLLARIHLPVENPAHYLAMLDAFAAQLRLELPIGSDPHATMRQLSHFLGQELGFQGNHQHYNDPRNSCLNYVLDSRTGIPITLSVIYLEVGWRLGLPLAGVGMPGHFLVKYSDETTEIILDPFHGGIELTPAACAQRLSGIFGQPVPLEAHYLAAVTRKQILSRMLANLKAIYVQSADFPRALETVEHRLLLSPWALDEIRDRGLIHAQLGHVDLAVTDLETYLAYAADAEDAPHIRQHLTDLRRRMPPATS